MDSPYAYVTWSRQDYGSYGSIQPQWFTTDRNTHGLYTLETSHSRSWLLGRRGFLNLLLLIWKDLFFIFEERRQAQPDGDYPPAK